MQRLSGRNDASGPGNVRRWALLACLLLTSSLAILSCSEDKSAAPDTTEVDISGPLIVPEGWGGVWEFTLTLHDCTTRYLIATELYNDTLLVGDTLDVVRAPLLDNCPGYIKGDSLVFTGHREFSHGSCQVLVDMEIGVLRNGDALTGSGEWSATLVGECGGGMYFAGCETIELTGLRTATIAARR